MDPVGVHEVSGTLESGKHALFYEEYKVNLQLGIGFVFIGELS